MRLTEEFAIAPSATAASLASQWRRERWFLFAIPVVASAVAGFFDWRWLIVALIMVFIIWPMALFFVWISVALSPEAVRSSIPHTVGVDDEWMVITYAVREGYPTPEPERISRADILRVEQGKKHVAVYVAGGRIILLPPGCRIFFN